MRWFRVVLSICTLTLLTGCWDNKDINYRTLPTVIGISKEEDNQFRVVLQVPVHSMSQGKGEAKVRILSQKGRTIVQALSDMQSDLDLYIDLLHLKLMILQDNLAKHQKDVREFVEFAIRSEQLPSKALVAYTKEDVKELMTGISMKRGSITSLFDFFNPQAGWTPDVSIAYLWQVYRSINSYTSDVAIPQIESDDESVFNYVGSAVVKQGKLVGQIDPNETLLCNLFKHVNARGNIEVTEKASVLVIKSDMEHQTEMRDGVPYITSDLDMYLQVVEKKEGVKIEEIAGEVEKVVKQRFDKMFSRLQKEGADILGIGNHFREKIPYAELKDWRKVYYPKAQVDFRVHATLLSRGSLKE